MIERPKNLTEQLLNLTERIAVEIKAIFNKLNKAIFTINNQEPDSNGNVTIDNVLNAHKATNDALGNNIASTYLTKDSATNTFALKSEISGTVADKAPIAHASEETKYGIGNANVYGHLKLSDSTSSASSNTDGVAATPKAVSLANAKAVEAYNFASEAKALAESALPATGKAVSAMSADTALTANTASTATKATQDSLGNVITDTYSTKSELTSGLNTKAPTSHASTSTAYGSASENNYGHVKLSNATNSTSGITEGIAATPAAVKSAYDRASAGITNASSAQTDATNALSQIQALTARIATIEANYVTKSNPSVTGKLTIS